MMKSKEELKKELHSLIDSIEDENILNELKEDVIPYVIKGRTEEDNDLTDEQWGELQEAIKEADEGKVLDIDEFKRRMASWHTK